MTTIKTVRDLIPRFHYVKLWLHANDSTKEKPATVLVRGIDGYEIEAVYPQYLDCEVVDFDMGEDGLNIFIEYETEKSMTKYEVWKEKDIEMRRRPVDYTVDDLEKFSINRTAYYHEPIAKFDTMEEAKAEFEKEKQYCTTRATDGYTFPLILFDELQLVEVEYDEDGEFFCSEVWDSYIADDECLKA